jgi:Cft2 family RNA processing exonuclease
MWAISRCKTNPKLNWQPLQVSPSTIECVLLTNGHLDHCGYLYWLIKDFQVKFIVVIQLWRLKVDFNG